MDRGGPSSCRDFDDDEVALVFRYVPDPEPSEIKPTSKWRSRRVRVIALNVEFKVGTACSQSVGHHMANEDEEDEKEDDDGAGFEAEGLRDLRVRG